jgi:hypothetical protein
VLLVIVNDLDVIGVTVGPAKANSPLIIDSDAVLSPAISGEFLQTIGRRHSEFVQRGGGVYDQQLAQRYTVQVGRYPANPVSLEESFGVAIAEAPNHIDIVTRRVTMRKSPSARPIGRSALRSQREGILSFVPVIEPNSTSFKSAGSAPLSPATEANRTKHSIALGLSSTAPASSKRASAPTADFVP